MFRRILQLDVGRFNRLCSIVGLVFLFVTIGVKTADYERRGLPQMQDYPQYYMGGRIALHGAWDSMYPIPNPDSHTNPGFAENSTLRPRYREIGEQSGVPEGAVRFMQPPPLALFMTPLAILPVKLSYFVWVILLILATWGIARQAGTVLEICLGRPTRGYGLLVLLICFSLQAHRWIRVGNMSALIGWLIGFTVLEMIRRDGPRAAIAMSVGTIAKYALLVLGPLQIAMRRWRTIAWEIGITVAMVLIALLVMGIEPFRTFVEEIAPTLGRTSTVAENSAIYAFILRINRLPNDSTLSQAWIVGFRVLQIVWLLVVLALILVHRRDFWDIPHRVFAGAAALICWLLLFSPIFWEHYHAYLAPFWGWLAYEAIRSRVRMVVVVLIIGMSLPLSILCAQLGWPMLPEPLFSHLMWSAVLMGALAIERLARDTVQS